MKRNGTLVDRLTRDPATLVVTLGLACGVLIAGAWWFEKALGLLPCKLCLEQRQPHYAAMAVAAASLLARRMPSVQMIVVTALLAIAGLMIWSVGLGVYHSGVEWGWFAGPNDCGGKAAAAAGGVQDFLKQLDKARVVSCTEAAWRFLGLSLAGWNALASLALAALALAGLLRARARLLQA